MAAVAEKNSEVRGAAPFVEGQGLISTGDRVIGTMVEGVDPKEEVKASEVASTMPAGTLDSLTPGSFHAVIGSVLAARLGVAPEIRLRSSSLRAPRHPPADPRGSGRSRCQGSLRLGTSNTIRRCSS